MDVLRKTKEQHEQDMRPGRCCANCNFGEPDLFDSESVVCQPRVHELIHWAKRHEVCFTTKKTNTCDSFTEKL